MEDVELIKATATLLYRRGLDPGSRAIYASEQAALDTVREVLDALAEAGSADRRVRSVSECARASAAHTRQRK